MEALSSSLNFWQEQDDGKIDVRNRAPESYHEEEEEDDDSLFELVINAPESDKRVDSVKNDVVMSEQISTSKLKGVGSSYKVQSPIALLKSAPRFRVLFLGFRKQKTEKIGLVNEEGIPVAQKHQLHNKSPESVQSKRFALDFDVEEVRIASLFSRDNSLRNKLQRERASDFPSGDASRKSPKDFPKYLNLIKPFYVRASKRYSESSRLSSELSSTDSLWSSPATVASSSPRKLSEEKRGNNRAAGFKALSKHLGKSRSASSTAPMTPSPASRRDDSLLLQNDGIQSAILHCKRSLYSTSSQEYSALWRSGSDPATGKPANPASNSSGAQIRCTSI